MKNKVVKLFLFVMILFLFIPKVHAKVSCDYVSDVIDEYYDVVEEIEALDCSDTNDSSVAYECNKENTRKAVLLSRIFKYNDEVEDCNKAELEQIVNDNEGECSSLISDSFYNLRKVTMGIFYMLAPFFLLIFGSLDFFKIVVESDMRRVKEHRKRFIKRLIAFVLLYLTPVAVNFALSFNLSKYNLSGNVYACNTPIAYSIQTWNSVYVPPVTTSSGGSLFTPSGSGSNNGLFTIRETNPLDDDNDYYYNTSASNAYQCVWYARSRAIEALSNSSDSERVSKVNTLSNSRGNGWVWYALSVPGEQSATRDTESSGTLDSLVGFQNSSDYTKPRAGSLISWQWTDGRCVSYHGNSSGPCYGHVAFVEDVDTANNKVLISDGWKSNGGFKFRAEWYDIDYVQSFGGNYVFQGYVYLFEPLSN